MSDSRDTAEAERRLVEHQAEANRDRDASVSQELRTLGWDVVRVWEHEDSLEAADLIDSRVLAARSVKH
jgi:G:T-mismatch repair DNA endonuclease (very short patch repair protein)